jgi:hypothetical protein
MSKNTLGQTIRQENKARVSSSLKLIHVALWVSFTAGALADIASNVFVVPMEVVVQRLQIQVVSMVFLFYF